MDTTQTVKVVYQPVYVLIWLIFPRLGEMYNADAVERSFVMPLVTSANLQLAFAVHLAII